MLSRIRAALPCALLTLALTAACDRSGTGPTFADPTVASPAAPSPTTEAEPEGPTTDQTCKAVTMALIDGSVDIADDAVKSIDERWSRKKVADELRKSFGDMAEKVSAEADRAVDPALKTAATEAAAELTEASKGADPEGFLNKEFQTLTKDIDKTCGN